MLLRLAEALEIPLRERIRCYWRPVTQRSIARAVLTHRRWTRRVKPSTFFCGNWSRVLELSSTDIGTR